MKVCIKTAGVTARKLYEKLRQEKEITVISFTDNDTKKWGDGFDGIPVESVFLAYEKYKAGELEKIVIGTEMPVKACRSMYKELIEIGFDKKDILFLPIDYLKGDSEECTFMTYENFNYLQYLEFHLTNRCNLNCSGCSHFAPLVPDGDEIDFDDLKKAFLRLRELVSHISVIRIMGGEPLLSSHLSECCSFVRNLFPYAYISVVTNGSLSEKKLQKELVETLKREDIVLDITCYPVFYKRYDSIAAFLKKNELNFHMDVRWGMCPVLHEDNQHKYRHDTVELTCECINLYKGRLYPCPLLAFIPYFNRYFNQNYPEDKGVDLYGITSFNELYNDLFKVRELCDHCDNYEMFSSHSRNEFKSYKKGMGMEDWIQNYKWEL